MDWLHTLTIIVSLGSFLIYHSSRIDSDIKENRQRTDQLYQMFVDLLKEKK